MTDTERAAVVQVSSPDEALVTLALRKTANLLKEHPETRVEIVVMGGAVVAFTSKNPKSSELADEVSKFDTVQLLACRNAMRGNGVDESDLADFVTSVPAGVARVVERQWDGWALFVVT